MISEEAVTKKMYGISEVISMKIGIMGGTFDPIHNGHLHLAQTALTQFDLDQIWFMPNGMPPPKKISLLLSQIFMKELP